MPSLEFKRTAVHENDCGAPDGALRSAPGNLLGLLVGWPRGFLIARLCLSFQLTPLFLLLLLLLLQGLSVLLRQLLSLLLMLLFQRLSTLLRQLLSLLLALLLLELLPPRLVRLLPSLLLFLSALLGQLLSLLLALLLFELLSPCLVRLLLCQLRVVALLLLLHALPFRRLLGKQLLLLLQMLTLESGIGSARRRRAGDLR